MVIMKEATSLLLSVMSVVKRVSNMFKGSHMDHSDGTKPVVSRMDAVLCSSPERLNSRKKIEMVRRMMIKRMEQD